MSLFVQFTLCMLLTVASTRADTPMSDIMSINKTEYIELGIIKQKEAACMNGHNYLKEFEVLFFNHKNL